MPVKAKVVGPAFDWNGVYVGAYAGAVWMDRATATDPCRIAFLALCAAVGVGTFNRAPPTGYDMNPSFLAGGTIGVNWQPDRVYDHPHAGNSNHQPRPELPLPLSVWQVQGIVQAPGSSPGPCVSAMLSHLRRRAECVTASVKIPHPALWPAGNGGPEKHFARGFWGRLTPGFLQQSESIRPRQNNKSTFITSLTRHPLLGSGHRPGLFLLGL
jgi:hypothetical protein